MKAVWLNAPGVLQSGEASAPVPPGSGEGLVRVRRLGVCGTDIHAFGGKQPFFTYPRILGHELCVEVLELGADSSTSLQPGDLCAVEPYLNCGHCIACRRGKTNCCVNMQVLGVHVDGGMREILTLPISKLHTSDVLEPEQLALVETLGIGCHAVNRAELQPDEFVLICGAGPIGLATIQFAMEAQARVIVLDINQSRLDFCSARLGVEFTLLASDPDVPKKLEKITGGDMPTVVFDATGNPASMNGSFTYPAHGGRLVFVGLFQGDVSFHDPLFHKKELTLLASRNALSSDFGQIIQRIESGKIDTRPWITHRGHFEDVCNEFPSWTKPETGVIKAMIDFDAR